MIHRKVVANMPTFERSPKPKEGGNSTTNLNARCADGKYENQDSVAPKPKS